MTATGERPGLLELLRGDYAVIAELTGDGPPEPRWRSNLLAPVRFVLDPSFRACLLFRLSARSTFTHFFWRSLLMALHSCEVMSGATIGPGIRLPHPFGITVGYGVVMGKNVTLAQNVTVGSDMSYAAHPTVGDGATILVGAVVAGPVTIGEGALIGANCLVLEDVEPGGRAVATGTEIRGRPANGSTGDALG